MLGDQLLVAGAVLDRRDRPVGEGVRRRRQRRARVHALRRDDPVVAGRQLGGVGGRPDAADQLGGAGEAQAALVDRSDVTLVEVVGPDLDVVELREVRREQRPDRAAANHADPHR